MTRKFEEKTLLVATHNQGKLEEIAALLEPYGVTVVGAKEKGLPEPEETGTTRNQYPKKLSFVVARY